MNMSIPLQLFCFNIVQKRPCYVHFLFNVSIPNFVLLETLAERRHKSISVEFNFVTVFAFKHHVSAPYVIVLLTIAW